MPPGAGSLTGSFGPEESIHTSHFTVVDSQVSLIPFTKPHTCFRETLLVLQPQSKAPGEILLLHLELEYY